MAKVRIVWNRQAHKKIRHMDVVVERCTADANEIARRAGDGFTVTVQNQAHTQRPRAYVHPDSHEAYAEEIRHARILKAAITMRGS